MKAIKQNRSVIALVFFVIAAFVWLVICVASMFLWDALRGAFGFGPFGRKRKDVVKIHPAIPGLVMDADGFVEPPEDRYPAPALVAVPFGVPSLFSATSMSDRRQSYHDAAPSVHSPGDAGFTSGVLAFPESEDERARLRHKRLVAQDTGPLPANVTRLSDFRGKSKK